MVQDLTTYIETDPDGVLTVIADKVTFTAMQRSANNTWLSKDMGAEFFKEAVIEKGIHRLNSYSNGGIAIQTLRANVDLAFKPLFDGANKFLIVYWANDVLYLRYFDGVAFHDDLTAGLTLGVDRFWELSLSGQDYTLVIYNGATDQTGVLDTLTVNAGEIPPEFRYHIPASNFADVQGASATGYNQSFELITPGGGGVQNWAAGLLDD